MKHPFYFLVEVPEAGLALSWIGGGLKPSRTPGKVWLTKPDGKPVLEVARERVRPSSQEETARRIVADRQAARAPLN
jgi:hypothetical protein